ncbi:MAG: DUF1987 family protein [Bacteroidetes bacterium]|nr:DUF1987 family protein [Bacteroidota bacterium]
MSDFKHIIIDGDLKSPHIDFNHLTGDLILSGRSIPENAAKVYEPLLLWIAEYIKAPKKTTNFRLNLDYFNSASTIWISKLIRALGKIEKEDSVLFLHIYFDKEDYEEMDDEDLRQTVASLVGNVGDIMISIGVKVYATESDGQIIKETTILL